MTDDPEVKRWAMHLASQKCKQEIRQSGQKISCFKARDIHKAAREMYEKEPRYTTLAEQIVFLMHH